MSTLDKTFAAVRRNVVRAACRRRDLREAEAAKAWRAANPPTAESKAFYGLIGAFTNELSMNRLVNK